MRVSQATALQAFGTVETADLASLPGSVYVYEFLTRSQHYHLGYFDTAGTRLNDALDRLALLDLDFIDPQAPVLDLGCGLGGTSMLLAKQGIRVLGIDPCSGSIHYASRFSTVGSRVRFLPCRLEDMPPTARLPERDFGTILMTEVTQHIPDLQRVLRLAGARLRRRGRVLLRDVLTVPRFDRARVPYHPRDEFRRAILDTGFRIVSRRDISAWVVPTLPTLKTRLGRVESELVAAFRTPRPTVRWDLREFRTQLQNLAQGFANGDLVYESWVLEAPDRP